MGWMAFAVTLALTVPRPWAGEPCTLASWGAPCLSHAHEDGDPSPPNPPAAPGPRNEPQSAVALGAVGAERLGMCPVMLASLSSRPGSRVSRRPCWWSPGPETSCASRCVSCPLLGNKTPQRWRSGRACLASSRICGQGSSAVAGPSAQASLWPQSRWQFGLGIAGPFGCKTAAAVSQRPHPLA